MKKVIFIFLLMIICLCPMNFCQAEELADDNFVYTLLSDGNAEITLYKGSDTNPSIPSEFDGHKIISIGSNAFAWNKTLETAIIPEGIISINDGAFAECTGLQKAELPESLLILDDLVFQGCTELGNLTLPAGLIKIGQNPFDRCDKIDEIRFTDENPFYSVIGNVLFDLKSSKLISYPAGLKDTEYTVPDWVETIGMAAFSENPFVEEIILPDGLAELEANPFCGCTGLRSVSVSERNLTFGIKDNALVNRRTHELVAYLWDTNEDEYIIPDGIVSIGQEAFYKHPELARIILPDSLTVISDAAFAECSGLIRIDLPAGLAKLGRATFTGCTNLRSIVIPEGITVLEDSLFYECDSLISVHLPKSIESIGGAAFYLCRHLRTIVIPEGTKVIGSYAFAGTFSLLTLPLPESLIDIAGTAFYADENITLKVESGSYA